MKEDLDKQITDNVPEFFFIWDIKTQKIIYLTQGYKDYTNFKLKKLTDYKRMLEFVHPDQREQFEKVLESFDADNAYQDHDFKVNNEIYTATWMNLRTFPVEDRKGEVYRIVAHVSDVSHRKAQLSEMEAINERSEDIIRMLAHDLKNPLLNIQGILKMAADAVQDERTDEALNFIHIMGKASHRSLQLIGSMLELLELSGPHMSVDFVKTDLKSLLDHVLKSFEDQFSTHNIELVKEITNRQVQVLIDPQKFQHVIFNLFSNAIKFTPDGGKVTVQLTCDDEHPVLRVKDTGVGICEDKFEDIFKEFSKVRRNGIRGEKSTGLGLSIAKKIVELHEGSITVESEPEKGATFIVRLKR